MFLKRPGRTGSSLMAPAAPEVLLPGKPAYVTPVTGVTAVACSNTVRLPPPGTLPNFCYVQGGLAHHLGAGAQVVQVLLYPQQVRVGQLVRWCDALRRGFPRRVRMVPVRPRPVRARPVRACPVQGRPV